MNPRTRALITVGVIITILTLFFLSIFIQHQKLDLSKSITMQMSSQKRFMELMISQVATSYQYRVKSLVKNRSQIIHSFSKKDRAMLLEQTLPVFKLLKKENPYFKTIYFINADNTAFLRVHNPQLHGDDISDISQLVKQTNLDKKMHSGFEIVKNGLFYRIAHPVFVGKDYIGVVGFSIDAYYFFKQLTTISNAGLSQNYESQIQTALVFPKQELKKTIFLKKPHQIIGECILFADQKSLFAKFPDNIDIKKPIQRIKIEGVNYASVHSAEFKNFKQDTIARAISLINIEPYVAGTKKTIKKTIFISMVLILLSFVILYLNFNILFRKINTLTKSLEQSNKELEARVKERTEELQQEIQSKKQIEEELKVIFKTIPDPIVVYNAKGCPLYLNQAFTDVFGWNLKELQGRHIPFVPEDQKQLTQDKIKEIYQCTDPVRFETKRLSAQGKLLDIFLSAAVLRDIKGINNGIVVNLKDITQQKINEAQLRQSQKMEAIGTLAGGIAHDFNNILSGIFGYTQLAEMNLDNPEKAREKIKQISKGAKRASDLVQQILTISRHTEQIKKPLALYLIVKEAVKFLRSSIPSTIKIETNIESETEIFADPGQAHQVVMNLCTNASQAMGDIGGILSISLKDVMVTHQDKFLPYIYKPGKFIKLEVKDTGSGMDNNTLEKIFNPYFTTKEVGKGTGLGLAVVDGIIKKHNGFIKLSSKINQGTSFEIFWPVIEKDKIIDSQLARKIMPAKKGARIMIVDDEPAILETSQIILEKQGYQVSIFNDGLKAFKTFKDNPDLFDLIITDMTMPQITGDKLAADILQIKNDIPILLCTGFSEAITEEKAASMGIKGFLMKPFLIKDLEEKILELLDLRE